MDYKESFILKVEGFFERWFNKDVALFIACQFALESAFGRSDRAKMTYNYSGMKMPSKRVFLGIEGGCDGFAVYYDLENCCYDYLSWVFSHRDCPKVFELESFVVCLIRWDYCPDSDYIKKICSLYNQFINLLND